MELNLIRLRSMLHNSNVKEDNDDFISRIFSNLPIVLSDKKDKNFSLVLIETGGTEEQFVKLLPSLNSPIYLLTNGNNNSLAASLEILTYLKNHNYEGEILHGDDGYIISRIADIFGLKIGKTEHRFGVVGKPSDWLIASSVCCCELINTFHSELIDISYDEFLLEIKKEDYEDNKWTKAIKERSFDKDEVEKALYIYGALKRLIEKYDLEGLTVRCFDLLDAYKNTSCLALAILNAEGYIATCEGDEVTMLTMFLVKRITNLSSFQANPSRINVARNEAVFAHCTAPLDMLKEFKLDTHFESSLGVAIKGELETKEVTLIKLKKDLKEIYVIEGKIEENLSETQLCRTQIRIKFDEPIACLLTNPFGNHQVIVYGHHKDEFIKALKGKIKIK